MRLEPIPPQASSLRVTRVVPGTGQERVAAEARAGETAGRHDDAITDADVEIEVRGVLRPARSRHAPAATAARDAAAPWSLQITPATVFSDDLRPLRLEFTSYLAHDPTATSADSLKIKLKEVGAVGSTVVYQELAASAFKYGAWTSHSVDISTFAGKTIVLQVEATDTSPASVVEAAVDLVTIRSN